MSFDNNFDYLQPEQVEYFHGRLLDEESKHVLEEYGYQDGLYLLRENVTDVSSYFLSICYKKQVFDYFIKRQSDGTVSFSSHQNLSTNSFIGPIELVNYFRINSIEDDNIHTKLLTPCPRSKQKEPVNFYILDNADLINLVDSEIQTYVNHLKLVHSGEGLDKFQAEAMGKFRYKHLKRVLKRLHTSKPWYEKQMGTLDENKLSHGQFFVRKTKANSNDHVICFCQNDELQKLRILYHESSSRYTLETNTTEFDSIIQLIDYFWRKGFKLEEKANANLLSSGLIEAKYIVVNEKLSSVKSGKIVYKGILNKKTVAIKKFDIDDDAAKNILSKESKVFKCLNHLHVIEFLGIYYENNFPRLVYEFASLGPFDDYLRNNKQNMNIDIVLKICYQIALAIEYLLSKNILHFSLIAHNVLLFTQSHSKLSDFGSLGKINRKENKEWIRFNPPEIILNNDAFDEKSCIWSFGVMCWEATSYAKVPYESIDIENICYNIGNGYRLEKPIDCPKRIYDEIIFKCWSANKIDRPSFSDLVQTFETCPIYDLIENPKIIEDNSFLSKINSKEEFKSSLKFKKMLAESDFIQFDKNISSFVSSPIYRGKFGKTLKKHRVAIKSKKINNQEDELNFKKFIDLIESFDDHPNIIKFFGICYQEESSYKLLFELAPLGRCDIYLRNRKSKMSMVKIVKICYQIALALEYLISNNIIHRNLALRKVLLVNEDNAKLSDFSLSTKLNEYSFYEITNRNKWPVKWNAPETNNYHLANEKSEIWNFGILCLEATSYGEIPYKEIENSSVLLYKLENEHFRLAKPPNCPENIFKIISECWNGDMRERPSFSKLVKEISLAIYDIYHISVT